MESDRFGLGGYYDDKVIISVVLAGLAAILGLIIAIGAQNAFLLRQGLVGRYVGWVVGLNVSADVILICIGIAGLDWVSHIASWVMPVLKWLAVVFLVVYGALAVRRAWRKESMDAMNGDRPESWKKTILSALALTWLNPHVYLDTTVLGSLALTYQPNQWWFAVGVTLGSMGWFCLLGFGARWLRPVFATQRAWRILDCLVALLMWGPPRL